MNVRTTCIRLFFFSALSFNLAACKGIEDESYSTSPVADAATPPTNTSTSKYVKYGNDGNELADTAPTWDCVMDLRKGNLWEVKTDDGGLRDKDWTYMNTHGFSGVSESDVDNGACKASEIYGDGITCDTEGYVADVNSAQLCGHQLCSYGKTYIQVSH